MAKYEFVYNNYSNGRMAVQVFEGSSPYATLSTNVPQVLLEDKEFVLNHDLLHPMFEDFLTQCIKSGEVDTTGKTCSYGFCKDVPIWKVTNF